MIEYEWENMAFTDLEVGDIIEYAGGVFYEIAQESTFHIVDGIGKATIYYYDPEPANYHSKRIIGCISTTSLRSESLILLMRKTVRSF